jgi:phosphatidate cytidylyltransferase
MKTRIIAGVSAGFVTLALVYWAPIELAMWVVGACSVLSYLEFDRLFFSKPVFTRQVGVSVMVLLTLLALRQSLQFALVLFGCFYVLLAIIHVVRSSLNQSMQEVVQHLSIELLGYIYVSALFGFVIPILDIPGNGKDYLVLLFLLVFVGDSAAYFVGKKWGKRPLASKVSPKKTIEGSIAAVVSAMIVAGCWTKWMYGGVVDSRFIMRLMTIAPVMSVLAQLGDLFESVLKRSQGQKDSGAFLPGHGGILDRVDGLAFSTPVFYFYVTRLLERG